MSDHKQVVIELQGQQLRSTGQPDFLSYCSECEWSIVDTLEQIAYRWSEHKESTDGKPSTRQEFIDYLNGPDYELFLHEVEWCFINGVPRHAEPVSDWDRHQANDDMRDAGRHGKMILVSPSSLAAALGDTG